MPITTLDSHTARIAVDLVARLDGTGSMHEIVAIVAQPARMTEST